MNYNYFFFLLFFISACHNEPPKELIGKWKIYKTRLNKEDMTKRSDPTNENGLEFKLDGTYISFGNPGHQDQGRYELHKGMLLLKSEQGQNATNATLKLEQDSLELDFPLDSSRVLHLKLYRME